MKEVTLKELMDFEKSIKFKNAWNTLVELFLQDKLKNTSFCYHYVVQEHYKQFFIK